jgi:hypothetical protein
VKRIYVSHPYAGDPAGNKAKVERICKDILASGEGLPISPIHLFAFTDDTHRDEILNACLRLLEIVDEVWVYGTSPGIELERAHAVELGIPVWDVRTGDAF